MDMRLFTFNLLPFLPSDELGNIHRVTNERIPTCMVHGSFDCRFKLNYIDGQSCTLCERTEFIVDRLDFEGVQREERSLASTLITHVLFELEDLSTLGS
jgi:hypothetical protein